MIIRRICRLLFMIIVIVMFSQIFRLYHEGDLTWVMMTQFDLTDWCMLIRYSFVFMYELCPALVYVFLALAIFRSTV